jgi:hypothetical protein
MNDNGKIISINGSLRVLTRIKNQVNIQMKITSGTPIGGPTCRKEGMEELEYD